MSYQAATHLQRRFGIAAADGTRRPRCHNSRGTRAAARHCSAAAPLGRHVHRPQEQAAAAAVAAGGEASRLGDRGGLRDKTVSFCSVQKAMQT